MTRLTIKVSLLQSIGWSLNVCLWKTRNNQNNSNGTIEFFIPNGVLLKRRVCFVYLYQLQQEVLTNNCLHFNKYAFLVILFEYGQKNSIVIRLLCNN